MSHSLRPWTLTDEAVDTEASQWPIGWRAPAIRTDDGLAADSPAGGATAPWWRHAGVRLVVFAISVTIAMVVVQLVFQAAGIGHQLVASGAVELIGTGVGYAVLLRIEGRRHPIELSLRRAASGLAGGLALGTALCVVVTGIIWALHGIAFTGTDAHPPWLSQLWWLGVVAGVSEELIFRGALYRLLESGIGTWAAMVVSGVVFGAAHLTNSGATLIGALAIALEAGVVFSFLYALTRSLWVVIGVHAAWNVVQGLGFGIVVSGSTAHGDGFLVSHPRGTPLLSGGGFGIEASVVSMGVWLALGCWLAVTTHRRGLIVKPAWVRHRNQQRHTAVA